MSPTTLEKLMVALEVSGVGMWELDLARRCFRLSGSSVNSEHTHKWHKLSAWLERISSADRAAVELALENVVQCRTDRLESEHRFQSRDGKWRWLTITGKVMRSTLQGAPRYLVGTYADSSAAHQLEAERDRYSQELHSLARHMPAVLVRFDRDYRCIYMNPGAEVLTGRPPSYFIGRLLNDYEGYPTEFKEILRDAMQRVFSTGTVQYAEAAIHKPWGLRHFYHRFCPEIGRSGKIETVLGVSIDVTEKNEAEQALQQTLKQQSDFIAMLSHELRNPLGAISTGLQILERTPVPTVTPDTATPDIVGIMRDQMNHITRLVDDLLDTARIENGTMNFEMVEIGAEEFIRLATEISRPFIEAAGQKLEIKIASPNACVHGDTSRLAQVITNLLHNASKFSPRDTTITVSASEKNGALSIQVTDAGRGIPVEDVEKIFNKFIRLNSHDTDTPCGVGLGLYVAKGIIDHHNGALTVAHSSPSTGTIFDVSIPLVLPKSVSNSVPPPKNVETSRRSQNVLLVDDNHAGAYTMSMLLELEGHTVTVASHGAAAIQLFKEHKHPIVILDIGLPDTDGHAVAKAIRSAQGDQPPLIIALTGWGSDRDRELSREAGCDAHLTKPVDFNHLQELMDRHEVWATTE